MQLLLLVSITVALTGCAASIPVGRQTETSMPHPGGCFVQVWDRPMFAGLFDYINGPQNYPSLRDLPGGWGWSGERIWSAKVGPDATVRLFVEEDAQGASMTLRAGTDYPTFPETLAGKAKSAAVMCAAQAAE